jgi:hypothetical protein
VTDQYTQPELPFGDELPTSEQLKLKDLVGCVVLIAVGGFHREILTRFDPKPAVSATVVPLNGELANAIFDDGLIFNTRPVRTLRGVAGRAFVAHVDIDNTTSNPSVVLLDPSPEEYDLARAWNDANPGLCNDLVKEAVAAYEEREAKLRAPMPKMAQQQTRSAPPATRSAPPAATNPEPGPPPPPRSTQPFDAVPPTEPGDDTPPF